MNSGEVRSWNSSKIAQGYKDALADDDRHIAINERQYHDPEFYALLPDLNGKTVLDIGCGNHYMDQELQLQYPGARIIGVDYPAALADSGAHLSKQEENPVQLVGGQADRLPFANDSTDFVLSSLLFHWLGEAAASAGEMYRVMKPGAGFVISVVHPDYFKAGEFKKEGGDNYTFKRTRDTTRQQELTVMLGKTIGPIRYYSRPPDEYGRLFEEAGFSDVALHAPLFTDEKSLHKFEHLRRYIKYPLHLFITGSK